MKREVTERDFRRPEFIDANVDDYEFRDDGVLVRKDRWERGIRAIAGILEWQRRPYEIPEVVAEIERRLELGRINSTKLIGLLDELIVAWAKTDPDESDDVRDRRLHARAAIEAYLHPWTDRAEESLY